MKIEPISRISDAKPFNVSSSCLRVTDPCYDVETWCSGELDDVKNGTWYAHVGYVKCGSAGERVAYLHIKHESNAEPFDHSALIEHPWENSGIDVGVDSGQAGVFDRSKYVGAEDKAFYQNVCEITGNEDQWGVIEWGVVSSSGFGDGEYECYIKRDNDNAVIEAVIVFLEDCTDD